MYLYIIISIIFLIIAIQSLMIPLIKKHLETLMIKSTIDGKWYRVKNTDKKQQVADTLATINQKINKLFDYLNSNPDDSYNLNTQLLLTRYNPEHLTENIDLYTTSYTLNKGQEVALCLSTRDIQNKIYDINTLMFVVIHELTHIGCITKNHSNEFKLFFKYLLICANKCGVYNYVDYNNSPVEYCGISINATPMM